MQSPIVSTLRRLAVGSALVAALSSCSLPPREAWRQIQKDGLIPFVLNEWGSSPSPAAPQSGRQMIAQPSRKPVSPAASATIASADNLIGPPVVSTNTTPSPAMLDATKIPMAQPVPGLAGYVRTPYTTPPRLVDVRGMTPGSKVVCPFTSKPFLVPVSPTAPEVAATPAPRPEAPKIAPSPSISPTLPAPSSPVAALTTPAATNLPSPTKPTRQPAANTQASSAGSSQPAPSQPKVEVQDAPFGVPIAGRPGFVNSPFAAKHQLVDVTGLPAGMEVKCPYTGKLFRVPPQDQAQGKIPVQNTASPEKK